MMGFTFIFLAILLGESMGMSSPTYSTTVILLTGQDGIVLVTFAQTVSAATINYGYAQDENRANPNDYSVKLSGKEFEWRGYASTFNMPSVSWWIAWYVSVTDSSGTNWKCAVHSIRLMDMKTTVPSKYSDCTSLDEAVKPSQDVTVGATLGVIAVVILAVVGVLLFHYRARIRASTCCTNQQLDPTKDRSEAPSPTGRPPMIAPVQSETGHIYDYIDGRGNSVSQGAQNHYESPGIPASTHPYTSPGLHEGQNTVRADLTQEARSYVALIAEESVPINSSDNLPTFHEHPQKNCTAVQGEPLDNYLEPSESESRGLPVPMPRNVKSGHYKTQLSPDSTYTAPYPTLEYQPPSDA